MNKVKLAVKLYWIAENNPSPENESNLRCIVRQLSKDEFKLYVAQTVTHD